jgi:cell division protein FtsW
MPARRSVDPWLLLIIIGLTLFGFMMVASASSVVAQVTRHDPYYFLKHQLAYGGIGGTIAFLLGLFVPYRRWRAVALPALLVALVLLVLVFVPGLSIKSGTSARWIGLGPITIQPSEVTKLAFIIYLAALLERKGVDIHDFRKGVVPFLVIVGLIGLLIMLQPDAGTLFIITAIAGSMVFVAGFKLRHLGSIVVGGSALFILLLNTAKYRVERLVVYLHPEIDPQGIGYQINQALLAVGTGGLWGLGFGRSRQKYNYLPEAASDSIFAVIAEELGLIRSSLLLLAYAFIAYRGYTIAKNAVDPFGRLVATGITTWLVMQAFVNIGSVIGITPLTGVPLPFISYGGSALVATLFAAGILLNISREEA